MSGPPHASSWATPPEFYLDENIAGKTLRRLLSDLGYQVHTPPELDALSASDVDWLGRVGRYGWVVISSDVNIVQRPAELAAYRAAKVHMFLLPGQARVAELCDLVTGNLADICAAASARRPGVWKVGARGLRPL
jgi:hypothetical protein